MNYDDVKLRPLLGELFKQKRLQRGVSQETLAGSLHIKIDTLRRIEKGQLSPRLECLSKLAAALQVDLKALFNQACFYYQAQAMQSHQLKANWKLQLPEDLCYLRTDHDQVRFSLLDDVKKEANKFAPTTITRNSRRKRSRKAKGNDKQASLLGTATCIVNGETLLRNLQGWLSPFDKTHYSQQSKHKVTGDKVSLNKVKVNHLNFANESSSLSADDVAMLQQSTRSLYYSRLRFGSGSNLRVAIVLLHQISIAIREKQEAKVKHKLYGIMADLADTVAKMTWHEGMESSAQDYFQLAMRAAHFAHDRLFGARALSGLVWQMHYLGRYQEALDLILFAKKGVAEIASPQVQAMLLMQEAWAYAALGQVQHFQRASQLAQDCLLKVKVEEEPYWIRYYDASVIEGMIAGCLRLLAIHQPKQFAQQAYECNQISIKKRAMFVHRLTALDYIGLAESCFLLKQTEPALNACEQALLIYYQLHNRCGEVRRRLGDLCQYFLPLRSSEKVRKVNKKISGLLLANN